jgi:hypothetical protein
MDNTAEDRLRRSYTRLLAKTAAMSEAEAEQYLELGEAIRTWTLEQSPAIDFGELEASIKRKGVSHIWEKVRADPVLAGANLYHNQIFLDQVRNAATRYYGKTLMPMFAGEYPTSELNGCVAREGDGALILINSGLPFLLNHVSDLVAGFAISNTYKGRAFETGGPRDTRSRKVTAVAIANALIWYLLASTRYRPATLPVPGEFQYYVTTLVRQEALKFVIAHEVAHAALGHIDLPEENPDLEFEADRDAISILRSEPLQIGMKEVQELRSQAQLAGPIFFFSLCALIEAAEARESIRVLMERTGAGHAPPNGFKYARAEHIGVTHPPTEERLHAIWEMIGAEQDLLEIAKAYSRSLNDLQSEILDEVEAFCGRGLRQMPKQ